MKALLVIAILGVMVEVFFIAHPGFDLVVTRYFYDGHSFYLKNTLWVNGLHDMVPYIAFGISVVAMVLLILNVAYKKHFWFTSRELAFLLLTLALGPGLLINVVFKEHWHRARPSHIAEFGGDKTFSEPFIISNQCDHNCSFVSGHPSVGFYLTAFALLLKNRRNRVLAYVAALSLGAAIGLARIAQGGHFLSDVFFSGLFTVAVVQLLHWVFFGARFGARTQQLPSASPLHPPLPSDQVES